MLPLNLLSLLRLPQILTLDLTAVNWEAWLTLIRTEAIISNVWQYIDPSIPDEQAMPLLAPRAAIPLPADIAHLFASAGAAVNHDYAQDQDQNQGQDEGEGDAADDNVKKVKRQYLLATLRHDREREWKIYDEKRDSLRVIRAYVLATAPAKWVTYNDDGTVGGGPHKDVRKLLVELREKVAEVRTGRALRWQRVRQQELQQRGAGGGAGAGAVGVSGGAGTANVRVGSGAGAGAGPATATETRPGTGALGADIGAGFGTASIGSVAGAGTRTFGAGTVAAGNAPVVTQGNHGYPSQEVWGGYVFPAQGYWG